MKALSPSLLGHPSGSQLTTLGDLRSTVEASFSRFSANRRTIQRRCIVAWLMRVRGLTGRGRA